MRLTDSQRKALATVAAVHCTPDLPFAAVRLVKGDEHVQWVGSTLTSQGCCTIAQAYVSGLILERVGDAAAVTMPGGRAPFDLIMLPAKQAGYGDHVRCVCGWDDSGELYVADTPNGLGVFGDEGRPRGFCPECDEPLSALSVEVVA